jgi:cation diffusion facilitator CzcD-associated flavoprotein CzcO
VVVGRWQVLVSANGGQAVRYTSRFLVAAAGALSVPTPNKVRHA